MQPLNFQKLVLDISPQRLVALSDRASDMKNAFAWHLFNTALAESLYPSLQMAELALRNQIDHALCTHTDRPDWFHAQLRLAPNQDARLKNLIHELALQGRLATNGSVVSALPFSFWTGFFNKFHAQSGLGHKLARQVFMNAKPFQRDLRLLDSRWTQLRILRNRVFHHERIVHRTDLSATHAMLVETIHWMSPELGWMSSRVDRFNSVFAAALQPWLEHVHGWSWVS